MFTFYMQPFFCFFVFFFPMEYTFFLRFQLRDKAAIYSEVKTMHFFLRKICMKKRLESAFVYLCIYLFIYLFIYAFIFVYLCIIYARTGVPIGLLL